MRKILISIFSLIIIFSLIFFAIKDKLNINKILANIENDIGINVTLKNKQKWAFFPKISYQNYISLNDTNNNLVIKNGSINITRDYWLNSHFIIRLESSSILYKGGMAT